MQTEVHARHMKLTKALHNYAADHLIEPVQRVVHSPAAQLDVELSAQPGSAGVSACRVILRMPRLRTISVSHLDTDLYRAIDGAHHRVLTAVKRAMERRAEVRA